MVSENYTFVETGVEGKVKTARGVSTKQQQLVTVQKGIMLSHASEASPPVVSIWASL